MRYSREYRVGIEEIGCDETATLRSILVFMEDCACWHSTLAGYGVREVDTIHRAWVVLDWKIRVDRFPVYEEKVTVSTWSRKMDGIRAFRDFEIKDKNNSIIASGTSKWILTDTKRRRPVRLTDDIVRIYETDDSYVAMDADIEDIKYDEYMLEEADSTVYTVRRSDIDVNRHVHNINYMDIMYEAIPEDIYDRLIAGEYRNIHINYKKEIKYGDAVECRYYEKDGCHTVVMTVDGKVHSAIVFSR